jgi:hypothetical protein
MRVHSTKSFARVMCRRQSRFCSDGWMSNVCPFPGGKPIVGEWTRYCNYMRIIIYAQIETQLAFAHGCKISKILNKNTGIKYIACSADPLLKFKVENRGLKNFRFSFERNFGLRAGYKVYGSICFCWCTSRFMNVLVFILGRSNALLWAL